MKEVRITRVDNGYIVESDKLGERFKKVFSSFSDVVREIETHFCVRMAEGLMVGGGTKVCDKCQRIHPVGADCPIVFAGSNPVAPEMH